MPSRAVATASMRPEDPGFLPADLRARARELAFDPGQVIFRTGSRPASLHYVRRGELLLQRHSRDGQPIVLQRVHEGFIAEASVDATHYHCDGVATRPTIALAYPIAPFRNALDSDARFRVAWTRHLANEIRRLRARCERLALDRASDRIVHYVETEGEGGAVELRRSLKSWALDLGLTHEALYRAIARMKRDGTLRVDGTRLALTVRDDPLPAARPGRGPR